MLLPPLPSPRRAFVELQSNYGHDAFLVEAEEQMELVKGFLNGTMKGLR